MIPIRRRWAVPLIITIFSAAAFALAFSIFLSNTRQAEIMAGRELQAIAIAAADRIPGHEYHQLFFNGDRPRPVLSRATSDRQFSDLAGRLRGLIASYRHLSLTQENIYTFIGEAGGDKDIFWGVMLHPQPFTGERYEPPATLRQVMRTGEPAYSGVYLSNASHREWISGYAPIRFGQNVIGVVEVAREVSQVIAAARDTMKPAIFTSVGVILFSAGAILVILQFSRRVEKTNLRLQATLNRANDSAAIYRTLVEASSDAIFALDAHMKVLAINGVAASQLGIKIEDVVGEEISTVLLHETEKGVHGLVDPEFFKQALQQLKTTGDKVKITTALRSAVTGEINDYRIIIEKVSSEGILKYLGRAVGLGDTMVATVLDRCHMTFTLTNSLILAEEISTHLAGLCLRYLGERKVTTYRIMLREMLLNAVEHGNLGINFDEKTQALQNDRYFELIEERRNREDYKNLTVTVHCAIDEDKVGFRITDQGAGFDHKKMIAMLRDEMNLRPHGRGIIMTMSEFDVVRYNDRGNSVLLIKHFNS